MPRSALDRSATMVSAVPATFTYGDSPSGKAGSQSDPSSGGALVEASDGLRGPRQG